MQNLAVFNAITIFCLALAYLVRHQKYNRLQEKYSATLDERNELSHMLAIYWKTVDEISMLNDRGGRELARMAQTCIKKYPVTITYRKEGETNVTNN